MRNTINWMVEVDFPSNSISLPEIGLYRSKLRMPIEYSDHSEEWQPGNATVGLLDEKWITSTTRSADVRRGGKYAQIGGATLRLLASGDVQKTLSSYGLSMYGKLVTIRYAYFYGTAFPVDDIYFRGVVSRVEERPEVTEVTLDSVSKTYNAELAEVLEGTDARTPVVFGATEYGKLVPGAFSEETYQDSGNTDAILSLFAAPASPYNELELFARSGTTDFVDNVLPLIQADIAAGESVYLKGIYNEGEGQYYRVLSMDDSGTGGRVRATMAIPNPNIGDLGFVESEGGDNRSAIVVVKVKGDVFADQFEDTDGFGAESLSAYRNGQYINAPEYGPSITFGDKRVTAISEGENVNTLRGFYRVPFPVLKESRVTVPSLATFTEAGIGNAWAFDHKATPDAPIWTLSTGPAGVDVTVREASEYAAQGWRYDRVPVENEFMLGNAFAFIIGPAETIGEADSFFLTGQMNQLTDTPSDSVLFNRAVGVSAVGDWGEKICGFDSTQNPEVNSILLYNRYPPLLLDSPSNAAAFWRESDPQEIGRGAFAVDISGIKETPDSNSRKLIIWGTQSRGAGPYLSNGFLLYDNLAIVGYFDGLPLDAVFAPWRGRRLEGETIINLRETYEHVVRLQNFRSRGINAPAKGWGKQYSFFAAWQEDMLLNVSTDRGGLRHPALGAAGVRYQIVGDSSATDTIKADLLRHMWALGTVDRNAIENAYPLIDALSNTDGVMIDYHDMDGEPKPAPIQYEDVFTEVSVAYNWDPGAAANSSFIAVTNVEALEFDPSYVTGAISDERKEKLWSMGRALFLAYGVKNEYPASQGDLRYIYGDDDAADWIENAYRWQGVVYDDEAGTAQVFKRYRLDFKIKNIFSITEGVDHGSYIRVKTPHIVDVLTDYHSGIVTTIAGAPGGGLSVTAEMLSDEIVGVGTASVIDEALGGYDEIDEALANHDTEYDENLYI